MIERVRPGLQRQDVARPVQLRAPEPTERFTPSGDTAPAVGRGWMRALVAPLALAGLIGIVVGMHSCGAGQAPEPTQQEQTQKLDGGKVAKAGADAIHHRMERQQQALHKTGVGLYYGSESPYGHAGSGTRQQWLLVHAKHGTQAATPHRSNCIDWSMEVLGAAYHATGHDARWSTIMDAVRKSGFKGTVLAKELQKDGWEAVYFNPDTRNPDDGNAEHVLTARDVAAGKPYYGIPVQHQVINYSPTPTGGHDTPKDVSGWNTLKKIPFFFGIARGGDHTFVGRSGKVNEFHWDKNPDDPTAITETPLTGWEWNSGVLMVPPGTWR